jgi:creatinine amidohydrolase
MTWKWEELTAPDFAAAAQTAKGVCVIPMGVIEKHAEHLPLGTDAIDVMRIAERAAEIEPAIIFPFYYFSQIQENKNYAGTIALRHRVIIDLLENTCEEIARNGLRKVVILNGHGGNESLLSAFTFMMLEKPRDFSLFVIRLGDYMAPVLQMPEWKEQMQSPFDHHAGEMETSLMMAVRPDLVNRAAVPAQPGDPRKRLAHLPSVLTSTWWYADFPTHYAGDARAATPGKGEFLLREMGARVATILKGIKDDTRVKPLEDEYFSRVNH